MKRTLPLKKQDLLWAVLFSAAVAMLIYKCPYGFGNIDESFYLQTAVRMVNGESVFVDDWNIALTSEVLLYPFMKLFHFLNGNSFDGVLLAFRYIFTAVHTLMAVVIYIRLRSKGYGAVIVSLLCVLYVPFGIMALSYNSMGLDFMLLFCTFLYSNEKGSALVTFLAGVFFAGAVLCCPFLALVYLAVCLGVLTAALIRRFRGLPQWQQLNRHTMIFTLACGVCAVVYLWLVVFSRCSLQQVLDALPHILNDPYHPKQTVWSVLKDSFWGGIIASDHRYFNIPVFSICPLLLAVILLDKKRQAHAALYFLVSLGLTTVYLTNFWMGFGYNIYINFLMFPLTILGFFSFLLYPRENCREMLFFWIPGMLYAICMNFSSNQEFFITSSAATVASAGSVLIAVNLCRQLLKDGRHHPVIAKAVCVTAFLFFSLFLGEEALIRYNSLFWEYPPVMSDMNVYIDYGVERGIWVTESRKEEYDQILADTQIIRETPGETVLYYTPHTWLYFADQRSWGTYTTWHPYTQEGVELLLDYYEVRPEKVPDVIYCPRGDYGRVKDAMAALYSYEITETELGYRMVRNSDSFPDQ